MSAIAVFIPLLCVVCMGAMVFMMCGRDRARRRDRDNDGR